MALIFCPFCVLDFWFWFFALLDSALLVFAFKILPLNFTWGGFTPLDFCLLVFTLLVAESTFIYARF
ncbi:hypothetical protein BKN38_08170 [Helicobacter sp. CLO-3]|nr:hypothetical protein BKN38_08170 [Helicobacter sp. CLO-3]